MTIIKNRYSHGRYILPSGAEKYEAVIAYITKMEFLKLNEAHRIYTRNRQHRLYSFYLRGIGKKVVLKIYWLDPTYSFMRRLLIWISEFLKDRCKASFFGALALREAGIETFRPLACWSYRKSWYLKENYLLYEEISADFSIREYRNDVTAKMNANQRKVLDHLISGMAAAAEKIHQQNIRHGDLAFCNFLVKFPEADNNTNPKDYAGPPQFYVIDTDRVSRSLIRIPLVKRILDIKSLRSIHLDSHEKEIFFKKYLGRDYSQGWVNVFDFFYHGRHRLFRRFSHWLRGKKKTKY